MRWACQNRGKFDAREEGGQKSTLSEKRNVVLAERRISIRDASAPRGNRYESARDSCHCRKIKKEN